MTSLPAHNAPDPDRLAGGSPTEPEHPTWVDALAALRERVERLEADVRRLQSQLANRA